MSEIKERPILFSGEMVRAILDGRKVQTRRMVKPQPPKECSIHYMIGDESWLPQSKRGPLMHHWEAWGGDLYKNRPQDHLCGSHTAKCPYGKPGDLLWVRETHAIVPRTAYAHSDGVEQTVNPNDDHDAAIYRQGFDRSNGGFRWRPSIHMPRWASRILLEVVSVRVERLQDISEEDAESEGLLRSESLGGCPTWRYQNGGEGFAYPREAFAGLWQSINGTESWDANPWVWVVEFRRVEP